MAYIDPVTGAYVEDGLDALPPGYNRPKPTDAASIARMRAQLNSEEAMRQQQLNAQTKDRYLSSPAGLVKYAYEHMPGAPIAQAALGAASDMFGGLLGMYYGAGKGIGSAITGNNQPVSKPYADIENVAQALHYTPPTQAGRDIYEAINKAPQVVTGSHMGMGPLPELWNTRIRFTPDGLRVAGKTAIEDIRNLPMDYMNARAGLQREYPTMGSRLAGTTEAAGNVARPLAEKAYDMYMNPSNAESFGINPVSNLSGLAPAGGPMYAVKPKGGNWPTNLGATKPLAEQGELGRHLSEVQYNDPIAAFQTQINKHFQNPTQNRELADKWRDFLTDYLIKHENDVTKSANDLKKEAADKFVEQYNNLVHSINYGLPPEAEHERILRSSSEIEQTLPLYNSWVMGPYQKYITNQMATGLATDPLLQAVNESGMPPHEIFGQQTPRDYEIESTTKRAAQRRKDFPDTMFGYKDTPEKMAALENSPIGKLTATTPEGMDYENYLDASLYPKVPSLFKPEAGYPVSAKLDRNTLISDFLTDPEDRTGFKEIRKQVFEDLISGKISPDKLSNVTPATVTRQMIKDKMAEFKEQQLSKQAAADWIPKRAAAMPTDMAFDDGSKMTIITPEMANADENMTARDLGQITIDLNQCIGAGCHGTQDYPGHGPYVVPHTGKPPRGKVQYDNYGYLKRLKNGDIEVASLKDPEGVSQVTIDLKLNEQRLSDYDKDKIVNQWIKDNAPDFKDEYDTNVEKFGERAALNNALQNYPELNNVLKNATPIKKSIQQMKGENNGNVKGKYVSHTVEWLNKNADQLTDVRDLDKLPGVHDLSRSYDSVGKMVDQHPHWDADTVEKFFDEMEYQKALPRFFTTDDFALKATERGVDLSASPEYSGNTPTLEQEAYQKLSIELRKTYGDVYLQEFERGDADVRQSIINDIDSFPSQYGMGKFGEHTRQMAIQRLLNDGLYTPGRELENVAQQFEVEPTPFDQVNAIRQQAYENLSETIIRLAPQAFEQLRDNLYIRQAFADVVRADPAMYGLTNYSPGLRERIIDRFAREGFAPEPEVEEQLPFDRPEFPDALTQNMSDYFEGRAHNLPEDMIEPYATETRILMGSQRPEARLPIGVHRVIVDALLDQDNRTNVIRRAISGLQMANAVNGIQLTLPQAENALNILIDWTERYPLNE
jgi:hypothetical protein